MQIIDQHKKKSLFYYCDKILGKNYDNTHTSNALKSDGPGGRKNKH